MKLRIRNKKEQCRQMSERSRITAYCENCTQCRFDTQRGMVCALTNEPGKFEGECEHFEPTVSYIERIHSNKNSLDVWPNLETLGGLMLFIGGLAMVVAMYLSMWSHVDIRGEMIPLTICVMITAAAIYLIGSYLRRIDWAKRSLTRLDTRRVKNIIRYEGYWPRIIKKGFISFKKEGVEFIVRYDQPRLVISVKFLTEYNEMWLDAVAEKITKETMVVKMFVTDKHDDGRNTFMLTIEAMVTYEAELKEQLPHFIDALWSISKDVGGLLENIKQRRTDEQQASGMRRKYIYDIEYGFFTELLNAVNDGKMSPEALMNEDWLRKQIANCINEQSMLGLWRKFEIFRVEKHGSYRVIIYQFPEPEEVPEAVYGAVLLDTTTNTAEYYTLEYSYNDKWVYGSTNAYKHFNYGEVDRPDLDSFIVWVLNPDKKFHYCTNLNSNDNETVN